MHLRSLTLHGFKSFVQRTQFDFETGITAIVGPNGSGKSNLADAFRWALGEQSLRALRGRRTEDVLFAGGPGRAPMGMAEVELTFDTSDRAGGSSGDLPYRELSIARRAYRSAENEYYVNRQRARLRDVLDLLGQIGLGLDGFGLVGQGAIDAALSVRAEDRRLLIEQAASIGHLHARLDDARARLDQTEHNLGQASALITELMPRLALLERQAHQVEERAGLYAELTAKLTCWYAHLLADPHARISSARASRDQIQATLAAAQAQASHTREAHQEAQRREADSERGVAALAARLDLLRAEIARLNTAAALSQERCRALIRRREESAAQIERVRHELTQAESELSGIGDRRDVLAAEIAALDRDLAAAERQADAWQTERQRLYLAVEAARRSSTQAESKRAAAEGRLHSNRERAAPLEHARAEHAARLDQLIRECAERQERLAKCHDALAAAQQGLHERIAERQAATERVEQAQALAQAAATRLAIREREIQTLRARVEALRAIDESGSGYFAGVRAVLRAANGRDPRNLTGIIGIVAKLIETSADYELALETALGGHAQDVVVERWADAESAIAYLKQSGAGRATFLPLDTLRPSRRSAPALAAGVIGSAASLVTIEPRLQIIADFLLGQTLVVETLSVARRVLRDCPPAWQIVTLEGDLSRTTGAVTGGAPASNRGTLQRQRELREGQRALAAQTEQRSHLVKEADQARRAQEQATAQLADLSRECRLAEEQVRQANVVLNEAQRQLDRAHQNRSWQEDELRRLDGERQKISEAITRAEALLQDSAEDHAQAAAAYTAAQRALTAFEEAHGAAVSELSARRSARDLAALRLRDLLAAVTQSEDRRDRLRAQLQAGTARQQEDTARTQEQEQEYAQTRALAHARSDEADQLQSEMAQRRQMADTIRAEQRALEARARAEEAALQKMHQRLAESERATERATAEWDALQRQIQTDLGEVDPAALRQGVLRVGVADPGSGITWNEAAIDLQPHAERLRDRLAAIRGRLRSLPADPQIIAEYQAAKERVRFLNDQVADLAQTAATLRAAIDETLGAMRGQFASTFGLVSASFERRFTELFGGGTARLSLDGEGDLPGVEVFAQPPGKRSQSLAMLSGGERALTAAALLFSLIEANPPPFCVLDEVDAALDENNVARFCHALRGLGDRTQFIVITHNRRTMEAATAIYGLTLVNRSESRVLSLKLPSRGESG